MLDMRLYLVTDRSHLAGRDFLTVLDAALRGGVTMIQLREKEASSREFFDLAIQVRELSHSHGVPLWINDRLDIALAVEADGLHIGQSDLPAAVARRLMPPAMKLGVSAQTVEQAVQAERDGADCLGVGAMFPTGTKSDAKPVSADELRRIKQTVRIPIVAIGGINASNLALPMRCGVDGVAVVSAIMSAPDPEAAARELREKIDAHLGK
ncbi:MAG TPA: thiamine phosphate synthase [Lentisphaeria bacterium]|nr:MAG: Thiamine-phosphate synthase [Lentisphaerae bacterium ADurb.Bin082]HQC53032.1 thiamine phosphate synthase [Lentisphaeria bacterium]HQL86566.1 thiamine phosphate synthase [Lentisphaeria bacterium]